MMKEKRFLQRLFAICLLVTLALPLFSQTTDIKVDGKKIYDLIDYMAKDEYLGRKPLTPEFFELLDWAKDKFEGWGLEPAGENGTYFQAVPISGRRGGFTMNPGVPMLKVDGREFFSRYGDFTIDQKSVVNKKMKGEIVFAGYGISAPEKGLDEYSRIDVKGKFVFVFKGSPADVKAPRGRFAPEAEKTDEDEGEEWKTESADTTKIKIAYSKGAAGIIFYNPVVTDDPFARFRRGRGTMEKPDYTRNFMIISEVKEPVVKWMFWKDNQVSEAAYKRRLMDMQLKIKAGKSQSYNTGLKIEVKGFNKVDYFGEQFGNTNCRNVIAKITGSDPVLKNEYIIMGGHYDHLGVRNGQVYNGADDNASGSAVTMELARLMKENNIRLKRTVIFCLWTGEELGLIGSRYYSDNPCDGVTMDQTVTYFNMDMVGLGDRIGAPGALNFPTIWDVIKRDQMTEIIDAVDPRTGGPGGSDHSGFIEKGIEALALMTSGGFGHPDYHDTGDDIDYIDAEILRKTGQFVLQGTINLGNEAKSLIIPKRQDLYNALSWNIAMINPALKAERGWTVLDADSKAGLAKLINDKIAELKKPADTSNPMMRYFRRFGGGSSFNQGLKGPSVFAYDPVLLNVAKTALGFGRLDVCGKDSVWFDNGFTECGKKGWKAVEEKGILITLTNPCPIALKDVLAVAEKPFIIRGMKEFSDELITVFNEKKVLITVDFDPADVSGCVESLEELQKRFADKDNILLNVTSTENLDQAKKKLYMSLLEKGWTHKEIFAIGGAGANRGSSGNLDAVRPPRAARRFGI